MNNQNIQIREAIDSLDPFEVPSYLHDLNYISASIRRLLPEKSFNEHIEIAKSCAFHQILAKRDEANFPLINSVARPNVDFSQKVIVTYHYSSYRLLNSCLINWSIPFKVIADDNYIKNQGAKTVKAYNDIAEGLGVQKHEFEVINAEDRMVLRKCIKAVNEGYALVFYADGNSGVGGMSKRKNMSEIPFLDGSIYVRNGIATLASILKAPVISVSVLRELDPQKVSLDIRQNLVMPENHRDVNGIYESNIELWKNLQDRLRNYPGSWEGWFYFHNFIKFNKSEGSASDQNRAGSSEKLFNCMDYGIGSIEKHNYYYLLDKRDLSINVIHKELYVELLYIIRENRYRQDYPVFKSLANSGVLSYP